MIHSLPHQAFLLEIIHATGHNQVDHDTSVMMAAADVHAGPVWGCPLFHNE